MEEDRERHRHRPSRADVYAFVSNQADEPVWHTDGRRDQSGRGFPGRLGSGWLLTVQFMGRKESEVQVTGLDPDRRARDHHDSWLAAPDRGLPHGACGWWDPLHPPCGYPGGRKRNDGFVKNLKDILER